MMAQSKKRSPSGLLSEAAKKAGKGIGRAAQRVVGKKPKGRAKSAGGLLSEAAKKAGRGVRDATRKMVGKRPTRVQKSGSR
jgi:hypothetical protein